MEMMKSDYEIVDRIVKVNTVVAERIDECKVSTFILRPMVFDFFQSFVSQIRGLFDSCNGKIINGKF